MNAQAQATPATIFGRRVLVLDTCTRAAHEIGGFALIFREGAWLDVIATVDGYVRGRPAILCHIQRPKRSRAPRMIVLPASELVTVAVRWA